MSVERAGHNDWELWSFYCPACGYCHAFTTAAPSRYTKIPRWKFDGNVSKPTFTPSLRVYGKTEKQTLCHLNVRNGMIEYCADCPHELARKTVPCMTLDEWTDTHRRMRERGVI